MTDKAPTSSRRRFLAGAGVTVGALGIGGMVYAQQNETTTFALDGVTAGWEGVSPQTIAGVTNPTLSVTYGQEYTIRWTNVDGAPHNIALLDANGNVLQRTQVISGTGQTQSITFTADESMANYICQVHPNTMIGQIAGSTQRDDTEQTTQAGNATNATGNETNQTTPVRGVSDIEPDPAQTGPLGESYHRFIASLTPVDGADSDATGVVYIMVYPSTGGWSRLVYQVTVENLDPEDVTDAHIHLSDSTEPVVAPLYEPDDVTSGVRSRNNSSIWAVPTNASNASNVTNASNASNVSEANASVYSAAPVLSWGLTLSYGNIYPNEFVGPLDGAQMIDLVSAMNAENAFAQIHTEDHPDGLLRGTIHSATNTDTGEE